MLETSQECSCEILTCFSHSLCRGGTSVTAMQASSLCDLHVPHPCTVHAIINAQAMYIRSWVYGVCNMLHGLLQHAAWTTGSTQELLSACLKACAVSKHGDCSFHCHWVHVPRSPRRARLASSSCIRTGRPEEDNGT